MEERTMPFMRFAALLAITGAFALCGFAQQQGNSAARQPWEWTVDERIAERCNRTAARARIERARVQRLAPTRTRDGGGVEFLNVTDSIIGSQSPHLLLPTELFESVVRNGFVFDGWREAFADKIAESGLPPAFWEQLETASTLYIDALREERRLAQLADRTAAYGLQQALHPRLCADRADALTKARALFGPALDIFMYRHVAPTKSLDMDHVESAATLKSREHGCR